MGYLRMSNFLKRTLYFNLKISILYIVAFVSVSVLSVLGIKMYGSAQIWNHNYQAAAYRYVSNCLYIPINGYFIKQEELPSAKTGILHAQLLATFGEDQIQKIRTDLILSVNEPFCEELSLGCYPEESDYENTPCVVIGPALTDCIYQNEGGSYIDLFGRIPCRVTGIFKPITLEKNDDRCYLFWTDIPDDIYVELFQNGAFFNYIISSQNPISENELKPLYDLLIANGVASYEIDMNNNTDCGTDGYVITGNQFSQPDASFMEESFFRIMCIFGFVVILLLSYFWTLYQGKKWKIQFLCGMSAVRIAIESLLQFFFYEVVGFGIVYGIYTVILISQNKLGGFIEMFHTCAFSLPLLFIVLPFIVCLLPLIKLLGMQKSLAQHLRE